MMRSSYRASFPVIVDMFPPSSAEVLACCSGGARCCPEHAGAAMSAARPSECDLERALAGVEVVGAS
eukprot:2244704-Pyramimonas_sp.AAC.2